MIDSASSTHFQSCDCNLKRTGEMMKNKARLLQFQTRAKALVSNTC